MLSYFTFWLKSSNQHGVHSPFVYQYLTKGLYEAPSMHKNKQLNWILKSIHYFKPSKVFLHEGVKNRSLISKKLQTQTLTEADLILIQNHCNTGIESVLKDLKPEQLLFICNQKYNASLQKKLRKNKDIVLVIDFYVGSLVSKRRQQLKQNFFLRL